MKKRVAFRSLSILLATALLLSSTSAYNLLVYANQDSVANSISAIESASNSSADAEPNITVQGGDIQVENESVNVQTQSESESLKGSGKQSDPFIIENLQHLLSVDGIVNATITGQGCVINTDKYFKLAADIDLAPLFAEGAESPFVNAAGNAYLVSADMNDPDSVIKYINIDGSYIKDDGTEAKHKLYISDPDIKVNINAYETFSLFGYLGSNSVISNIIFEDIDVSVTAIQPQLISVISILNEGRIENCEINDCSIQLSSSSTTGPSVAQGSVTLYTGIAAAVADNRSAISGVKVNNFTVDVPSTANNDYIAGLVGQNRGLVESSSISGVKISVTSNNHYVGGLVGYNAANDPIGIKYSSVDFAGADGWQNNITGGGYVGGLVGVNDGYIFESSVKGTVTSAQAASTTNYNIRVAPAAGSENVAYYGGITGLNSGSILSSTAADVGFYMPQSSSTGYYGGISAVTTGDITGCVASGSFVSNNIVNCYAGGIIAYADSNTPDGAVSDCYALVNIKNSSKPYIGAVVGYGGTINTATRCYWSDAISSCVTAYVVVDSTDSARPYIIESKAGKLVSTNRGISINRGGFTTVSASELVHTFNAIPDTTPATVSVTQDISVNGSGSNNSLQTQEYKASFAFPGGIGCSTMSTLDVSINFDVFVTAASGDPDDINNPLVISSTAQSKYLYLAPYGHYKLINDIAVSSSAWLKALFTGTLDGNNNIIATDGSIFRAVIGSRDKAPLIENYVTDPETATADVSCGTLKNINIELYANIDEAVLGTVYNATVLNIALTDGDPTADDGDDTSYEGYIAYTTKTYSAPFIDCAVGNSYVYGCSSDVSVVLGAYNYTAGFIGFVSGNVYVDNCSVISAGAYILDNDTDKPSRALFIGNTKSNEGFITNSVVSGRIIGDGKCYMVIGEHKGQFSNKYKNLVWSAPEYDADYGEASNESDNISKWGGESIQTKQVNKGEHEKYSVIVPANVTLFKNTTPADFSVSLVSISADKTESDPTNNSFSIEDVTVENGTLIVDIAASASATVGDEVYVKIYHYDTEFLVYAKYLVKSSVFEKNEDGYYHIASASDMMTLSTSCAGADASSYLGEAYKLVADIDMKEVSADFIPIGTSTQPFTGVFDGNGYKIENLHLSKDSSNVAIFGVINSSYEYTIGGKTVKSGVFDLTVSDSSFAGTNNVAVIAGSVSSGAVNIYDISVIDTTVKSSGKDTGAILASALNSNLVINNIKLDNVSVRTNYAPTTPLYFMQTTQAIGGIGGIVGSVCDSISSSHSVKIHSVEINKLDVCGYSADDTNAYATVNAGALIGTYHKYFNSSAYNPSTLDIGVAKSEDDTSYNITVTDSTIMSAGMAGGLVGSTNAKTTIVNALVSGTGDYGTQILSETDYYIGGIAGYIGHYTRANDALTPAVAVTSIYGTVTDCSVENVAIRATDSVIGQTSTTNKKRNVNVGGIVGAINGPATGDTLLDCTVKNSLIEGVVTGGIVASNININANTGNVVHITNCDVIGSKITTPENCYPLAMNVNAGGSNYFGVGGIMGTNRASINSYITDLVIKYCDVDNNTEITNYIPFKYGTVNVQAVTGGIVGSCTQYATGVQILLQYNTVSAYLYTPADSGFAAATDVAANAHFASARVATGGFIGMFNGDGTINSFANAAMFSKLSVHDSVFDGSIVSTDCIGGAIGSVINSCGRKAANDTVNYLPEDVLKNIIISGSLKSTVTTNPNRIRGGIAIGNIPALSNNNIITTVHFYPLQFKTTEDMTKVFSNVYFSSFDTAIDFTQFPFLGYANALKTNTNAYMPNSTATTNLLRACYVDVNRKEGNQAVQLAPQSSASDPFVLSTLPAATRGSGDVVFSLDTTDNAGKTPHWKGSDSSVATVSDTAYNSLTVTPKTPGTVYVSIDYVGYVNDSNGWSYEAKLPVGFVFTSSATLKLQTVEYQGKTYYLINAPIDFKYITGAALGYDYWLADNIEFTEDMFDTGKTYAGGFAPIGTSSAPFTGSIGSRADGSEIFEISGVQLKASADTNGVSALFGYADGAEFYNFKISGITTTDSTEYSAAVAAVVKTSLSADGVQVANADISGAKYSAGLFGGMFGGSSNSFVIKNSTITDSEIVGKNAAAGIVVHSDKNNAAISGVSVINNSILQDPDNAEADDSTSFDNGAAGISVAFAGTIGAENQVRNTVARNIIKGEIASGAVVRSYSSASETAYTYYSDPIAPVLADSLSISAVDISATTIEGTHTTAPGGNAINTVASGGILARVDAIGKQHIVSDCTLDSATTVKAPYAAGGIVGTFESPRNTTAVSSQSAPYYLTVDGCKSDASVQMTIGQSITSSSSTYYTMGVGGVIGCFAHTAVLSGVNIRNCNIGGSVSGLSAVGGLIGALWTDLSSVAFAKFTSMTSHFAENCVISAKLKNINGEDAFASNNRATGIIIGHVYDIVLYGTNGNFGKNTSFTDFTNQPFFNIYYSSYNYSSGNAYLFGVLNPGASNTRSMNTYDCYTDYIYEMNNTYTNSKKNHEIDKQTTHALIFAKQNRIANTQSLINTPEENGTWVIDSRLFTNGITVSTSGFTFDTDPKTSDGVRNYTFDASASIESFVLSTVNGAGSGAGSTTATLESVRSDSGSIAVEEQGDDYIVRPTVTLTKTTTFNLVFTYSNGLELTAAFRVDVSGNDYYYNSATNTYFVFNASNLYSTIDKVKTNSGATIIQCYDIFCSAENSNPYIATANSYAGDVTIGQIFAADSTLLEQFIASKHPNPEYDSTVDPIEKMDISVKDYLGVTDVASTTLNKVVKEITASKYGDYTENSSDRFDVDFTGTYRVLKSIAGVNTGLTSTEGEYYSIFGYEIHDVNVTAQGNDAVNVGFFDSLNGATVEGATFVNPKIEVIASKGVENNVGVLAGSAVNATVNNVSVERYGMQGNAYVMSIRQMTAASTNVGGIVGNASATSLANCSVSGLDVVGSTLAGNVSDTLHTVKAGGIAGVFAGDDSKSIVSPKVNSSRILIERNDRFRNLYVSYAGGIAAWASGSIIDAEVLNTQLRDVSCTVNITDNKAEGVYSAVDNDHNLVADRIGGIVAYAYGTTNISSAVLSAVVIRTFDIAGGLIGEVENSESSSAVISNSKIGDYESAESAVDIRIFSSSGFASGNKRTFCNVAGGAVGQVYQLSALNISGCEFSGYVGTYSYDNLNKDCTAGGMIGCISDHLTDLSVVSVTDSTVSGTVAGFNSGKTDAAMLPYLGAAGGFIGKIRTTVSGAAADGLVSHGVMSAVINLYKDFNGNTVEASEAVINPAEVSTNVGKIIGSVVEDNNFAKGVNDLTPYINNIYYSSYPQDIVAFGCKDFYAQSNADSTYTDINKATYNLTDENGAAYTEVDKSFMVGSATDVSNFDDAANDSYSSMAIIPIDTKAGVAPPASRFFRLMHDNCPFSKDSTKLISFDSEKGARIVVDDPDNTAVITIGDKYENKYGTFTISNVEKDIVGEIVLSYSYGLEVSVQLISMDIKGNGTEESRFEISNAKHFAVVRALPGAYFKQVANIDLLDQYGYSEEVPNPLWAENGEGFEPIGSLNKKFTGKYDGQGYLITNLYINRPDSNYLGLFGHVGAGAVLENIHIELAGMFEAAINKDSPSSKTSLAGGITGKNNVGGLAGYANGATITNCSVVRGNIIANTAVGGLIGRSDATKLDSCFTSTTTYSKLTTNAVAANKNVGGLIGMTGAGTTSVSGSFTFGYASLGALRDKNEGAVGGMVGYVTSGSKLNITNAFVGTNVSDHRGAQIGDKYYKGLTVGSADSNLATVEVSNILVAVAGSASQSYDDRVINPVLGVPGGASTTVSTVIYDSDLLGVLIGSDEQATAGSFTLEHVSLATNAADDSYTQAYKALAQLKVEPSEQEISDRVGNTKYVSGLFYPVTVKGSDIVLSSSVMDMTDTEEYPAGMDADFYGNGSNKNTDLLFKNVESGVRVYSNIYKTETGGYTGTPYDNGEMFYNDNMPYFIVSKTSPVTVYGASVDLYRKVVYPIQHRYIAEDDDVVYPLATERQLSALSNPAPQGTKFAVLTNTANYTLTDNIELGSSEFTFSGIDVFNGYFDGNGYKISNVSVNKPAKNNVGFVGTLTDGAIRNLTIEIASVTGADNVGALVGLIQPSGTSTINITDCTVVQLGKTGGVIGQNNVGGLVGAAYGSTGAKIQESNTEVNVNGVNVVGGLVGYNEMAIDNCYSTGDVVADITADCTKVGVGGLVGVSETQAAKISYSFSSSTVEVPFVNYAAGAEIGVGGLVGCVGETAKGNPMLSTVFSSGSVRYHNVEQTPDLDRPDCDSLTLGVGGLVGVLNSDMTDVYSSASVVAYTGEVDAATAVGIGGVVGVSLATVQTAYSSGSTFGEPEGTYTDYPFGVGGVIGVVDGGASGNNLYFDLNVSVVDDVVGKIIDGSTTNTGSKTTKVMTDAVSMKTLLSNSFGYSKGAYPFLTSFLDEDKVSRTIMFNALLSVVAIQLNELDEKAANGEGISMAMTIPTGVEYGKKLYTYGFEADLTQANSATSIVDEKTNTLSVQRTSNTTEMANFTITVRMVDDSLEDADGTVYSTIASRPLSRLCAQMLGNEEYPYLISSQTDLEHVAMSGTEYQLCPADSIYSKWNTPIDSNEEALIGKVYYRLMGYLPLDGYNRSFSELDNGYSFDGNGYSIRNLECTLVQELDSNSSISNVTFENVTFSEDENAKGESLVGTLDGTVEGVNIFGTASGNGVAGIAQSIGTTGFATGNVVDLDYTGEAGDSFAGIAHTNKGTVSRSAFAGNISGTAKDAVGLVTTNNGVIMNCFTMGDIILESPTGVVAGFVGTNNNSITNCYTRCNVIVTNAADDISAGSFVAVNSADKTILGCYAAGLFSVKNSSNKAVDIDTIFVGDNKGYIEECVFDKQLSGSCFMDDFYLADRTFEVATLSSFNTAKGAYTVSENTGKTNADNTIIDIEYAQLNDILSTKNLVDGVETVESRMYRTLRSYSKLSAATTLIAEDNYIDNMPYTEEVEGEDGRKTLVPVHTISNGGFTWISSDDNIVLPGSRDVNNPAAGRIFTAYEDKSDAKKNTAVLTASLAVEDFYNSGEDAKIPAELNLHITVTNAENPNFSGGNGTSENPFIIMNKYQFVALSYYGTNANSYFEIGQNIDFTPAEDENVEGIWSAYIGEFNATLDGKNYTVSNVTIPVSGNNAIFGAINGGEIKDITFDNVKVAVPEGNTESAGMLAAKAADGAKFSGCNVNGELSAGVGSNVGGLVGETSGKTTFENCTVSGTVTGNAQALGGLVGSFDGGTVNNITIDQMTVTNNGYGASAMLAAKVMNGTEISDCNVSGELTTGAGTHVGGLVGETSGDVTISGCEVSGEVTSGADSIGGIAGVATELISVTDCLSTVNITADSTDADPLYVGGILGKGKANIKNNVYVGDIDTAKSAIVGGIVGKAEYGVSTDDTGAVTVISAINGCVVSGKIAATGGYAGGVAGTVENGIDISDSLSTVLIVDNGSEALVSGGIVGAGDGNGSANSVASVTNTVFAGNVNGSTVGNIAGDSSKIAVTNSCYDKQLSMVYTEENGVTASSTYYLTSADISEFLPSMGRISGFEGYPVPAAMASGTGYSTAFMNAVKLASAKISFTNGVNAGSTANFNGVLVGDWGPILSVAGSAAQYFPEGTSGTSLKADTSSLALGQTAEGEFTYTLAGEDLVRYIEFTLGKSVKAVKYKLLDDNIADSSKAIISVITGSGESKSAVTAFDDSANYSDTYEAICDSVILAYDEALEAYTFTVTAQLDDGLFANDMKVYFDSDKVTAEVSKNQNGSFTAVIKQLGESTELVNFTTISIDITAVQNTWGVHKTVSNF